MTTINAIRFDDYSGALVCDETRGWNEENLQLDTAYKIKPVVPKEIRDRYGIVAAYGNTGTSTIGDELKFSIEKRLRENYRKELEIHEKPPATFKTIEEIAGMTWDIITQMKHDHIDQHLLGRFGFSLADFCRGYYEKDSSRIDIKDKDVIKQVHEVITWKSRGEESRSVFLNAGILAGFDPVEKFRIFHFSMIAQFFEPLETIFVADGSGVDSVNLAMSDFTSRLGGGERRDPIDRVEGLFQLIHGVNNATRVNLGCGGYYNIIYINGRENDHQARLKEISDHRSKLASEIVHTFSSGNLREGKAFELLDALIYQDEGFENVEERFWSTVGDPRRVFRFLRGFKGESYYIPISY